MLTRPATERGSVSRDDSSHRTDAGRSYAITVCRRALPVDRGTLHPVTEQLRALGRRVTEIDDGAIDLDPDGMAPRSVLWIQGNPTRFPEICRQLSGRQRHQRPLVVLWFSEPLPPPRAAGLPRPRLNLREIAKILLRDSRATDVYSNNWRLRALHRQGLPDVLVASTPARRAFLAEHGIDAHFVPLGYLADRYGGDLGLSRDVDVLFLGALVPRRKRLLRRLERRGVKLRKMGSWFDPACWGENRTRLLNRTRIFLNIARYPGELPGLRLILGMANKALVVSEPIHDPGPYIPGRHYVSCTLEEMPEVIRHYLANPDERDRIAAEGHRLVTEEVTLERSARRILGLIDAEMEGQMP